MKHVMGIAITVGVFTAVVSPVLSFADKDRIDLDSCIARQRQLGHAVIMYMEDYEGRFPPVTQHFLGAGGCSNNLVWPQLVSAYGASYMTWRCPSDPNANDRKLAYSPCNDAPVFSKVDREFAFAARANRGFNWLALSPYVTVTGSSNPLPDSTIESRVGDPGATLLMIDSVWDRMSNGTVKGGGMYLADMPCTRDINGALIMEFRSRVSSYYWMGGWTPTYPLSWLRYGGAWPYHAPSTTTPPASRVPQAVATMVDGHAQTLSPARLGAGCDVRNAAAGRITNPAVYLWDLN